MELAPIELNRNKQKITVSMRDQSIFSNSQVPKLGSTVNINTSIDVARAIEDRVVVIPFSLQNDDFNLSAQLKIFNQQDKVYLEFESYIDQIDVSKINQNIPEQNASAIDIHDSKISASDIRSIFNTTDVQNIKNTNAG